VDSGAPLGAAFGGVIIAWLILSLGSWRTAFVVAGIATIAARRAGLVYLRDEPADHPSISPGELS